MRPDFSVRHLAERHEHEGRRDADGAAEHGDQDGDQRVAAHVRSTSARRLEDREAAVERLADQQHHEDDALQHQHGGVRQVHAALDQAARRGDAAEQDRDRHDGERVVPGQEGDEDAGEAVAGDQRGIGLAVDRGDLEEAGKSGAGAGDGAAGHDQPADRQALRQCRARIAAGDARGEAEGRARHQRRSSSTASTMPAARPQCTSVPGMVPIMLASPIGTVDGLLAEAGSRSSAFDEEVHDGDGDVGEQQRGDRLVDAARSGAASRRWPIQTAPAAMAVSAITAMASQSGAPAADERDGDRGGREAAEHQRALAADHDRGRCAAGMAKASAGEDERGGALQRVLEREGGAEAAAPDQREELGRATCRASAGRCENSTAETTSAPTGIDDVFRRPPAKRAGAIGRLRRCGASGPVRCCHLRCAMRCPWSRACSTGRGGRPPLTAPRCRSIR